jgi:hypothetical protein
MRPRARPSFGGGDFFIEISPPSSSRSFYHMITHQPTDKHPLPALTPLTGAMVVGSVRMRRNSYPPFSDSFLAVSAEVSDYSLCGGVGALVAHHDRHFKLPANSEPKPRFRIAREARFSATEDPQLSHCLSCRARGGTDRPSPRRDTCAKIYKLPAPQPNQVMIVTSNSPQTPQASGF